MSKSMWIAFKNGGIIPASVTGGEEKKVGPYEPVKVPADYGQHLVDDRFAYKADEPVTAKGKSAGKGGKESIAKADLTAAIDDLKKAVEDATDLAEKTRLAAELAKAEDELAALDAA